MSAKLAADSSVRGSVHAILCDLSNEEDILAMFASIKAQHGGVDVCVNNAGIALSGALLVDGSTSVWKQMMAVSYHCLILQPINSASTARNLHRYFLYMFNYAYYSFTEIFDKFD